MFIVGPEATLVSSPRLVSETIKVHMSARGARRASAPPFTAENARRTAFTSEILAPHDTSIRFAACRSAREISSLTGHSIMAEPPPEIRKRTIASSALARSSSSNAACAAARLSSFGNGCPPRSEEHTSELQSLAYLVCRLLLEKKKIGYQDLLQHQL